MSTSVPLRVRRVHDRVGWPARGLTRARVLCGSLILFCLVVVIGWVLHVDPLVQAAESQPSMKLNTALAVSALAAGHLLVRRAPRLGLFAFGGLVGLLVLVEYAWHVELGIDQALVDDFTAPGEATAGRPAGTTAACLLLLALAGTASELGRRRLAQWLAAAPLVLGMIAVYGCLYGIDSLLQVGPYSAMSVLAAVSVVVLSLATWLAVPGGTLQWVSFGRDTGAALQRMLLPVAVVLLPFAGWIHLWAEHNRVVGQPLAAALLMSFVAVVVMVAGYLAGRTALGMDTERDALLDELHRVNAGLEDRVRGKAQQLNRQKTKIALFEERDRIARDLHDRVIQRIFAAGLQVASISRTAHKEAVRRDDLDSPVAANLDLVARELDLAIRELRNSIFELTSVDEHDTVEQVARDIAARAARILGFLPRVDVSGAVMDLPVDLVAQVASVIQEALSNVARHARAGAAEVVLESTDEFLQVRVTDDGVGLPDPLPRSSGINNLMNRARNLGGTATWSNREPTGTVLVWRVPLDANRNGDAAAPPEDAAVTGFAAVTRAMDRPPAARTLPSA